MAESSGDCSDIDPVASGNKSRQRCRADQKRKRRIVMRIEFDDSDDTSSASDNPSSASDNKNEHIGPGVINNGDDLDERPSCSSQKHHACPKKSHQPKSHSVVDVGEDSDEFRPSLSRRLRSRRFNVLNVDSDSDGSSSDSEITRKRNLKNYVISEEEREKQSPRNENETNGFTSDSSNSDILEKCPICLLSFRQQEIGSPATCQHIFCANCIEAWSKNVQTCPIDRLKFKCIIVRKSYENRKIVREINVNPDNANKELLFESEVDEEDVTNCQICNSPDREDVMLLCDSCNHGYHIDCLTPPLLEVPDGSWYCDNCVDSQDEEDDVEEDLNALYEDIRDMGIPQSLLHVTEVQQPRILRTRLNERIRAAVLRRTRSSGRTDTRTTTTMRTLRHGRSCNSTTTTTTTTRRTGVRNKRTKGTGRKTRRPKRRRTRRRTYIVEYDIDNFDEKFAIKTTKRFIRRRRRKRHILSGGKLKSSANGIHMTASKRLAEQMGVKSDPIFSSHFSGASTGLSLFGNANDLEYFSDSDNGGNIESEIHIETGHGTAVQTSVHISNYGNRRSRKGVLLGKVQRTPASRPGPRALSNNESYDLLSSIIDIQDRWHNATRNLESVHINSDGTLNLPRADEDRPNNTKETDLEIREAKKNENDYDTRKSVGNNVPISDVTQAPMYSRGGGNPIFNNGGGGNYNTRYNTPNNYHVNSSGGGGSQYRHSTSGGGGVVSGGGSSSGSFNNMIGHGNFNFSNSNYINQNPPNFPPFPIRFNQFNQQNNNQRNNSNNQRNSLAFSTNINESNVPQEQQLQHNIEMDNIRFNVPPPMQSTASAPILRHQPPMRPIQDGGNSLFAGLPPPIRAPPSIPPLAPVTSLPPRALMSIPPPPAPPPGVNFSCFQSSLFQLNTDYGNDDDDSNCPNFSVYSAESQEVAKSSDTNKAASKADQAEEDDENEDLVQLDDDEEIPMPPEPIPHENVKSNTNATIGGSDLYEPENPTEEIDYEGDEEQDEIHEKKLENCEKHDKDDSAEKEIGTEDDGARNNSNKDEDNKDKDNKEDNLMKEGQQDELSKKNDCKEELKPKPAGDPEKVSPTEHKEECEDYVDKDSSPRNINKEINSELRSPSPAISEVRPPESESSAANRKGVLELYDDSDWDELDIDRPKEYEKSIKVSQNDETNVEDRFETVEEKAVTEQDRSYTPCLDENNDPEESDAANGGTPEVENNNLLTDKSSKVLKSGGKDDNDDKVDKDNAVNMDTEMISEDDENDRRRGRSGSKRHSKDGHDKNEKDNVETFKKVSNRQKERNYRGEKQQNSKRLAKRYSPRSESRSRSHSRLRSLSRSRSRSRTNISVRSRSRTRSRTRSRSQSSRSRWRARSHSRSFNKENRGRRGGVRQRFGHRSTFQTRRLPRYQQRPKRREMPRYDVRNVIGQQYMRFGRDRYGRDTSRQRRSSRSMSRGRRDFPDRSYSRSRSRSQSRSYSHSQSRSHPHSRSRSRSPSTLRKRMRRFSISLSPSPGLIAHNRRSLSSPSDHFDPPRRRSNSMGNGAASFHQRSPSPLRGIRSRSISAEPVQKTNERKVKRRLRGDSPLPETHVVTCSRSNSISLSAHYTPRLSRSRSKSPRPKERKKKKPREKKKKKQKKRVVRVSVSPNTRIARQPDPFKLDKPPKKKRHRSPRVTTPVNEAAWSPSPSPAPVAPSYDYQHEKNVSWTPPVKSPRIGVDNPDEIYEPDMRRSISRSSRKDKHKHNKKRKKPDKRRDGRKEKKRRRHTETPEPAPSKEVFASGNNILVSVSFNKEATSNQQQPSQTTVVTLPPSREDLISTRRVSIDRLTNSSNATKKRKEKRKKIEAKPVAIIDLERSPFQVHQEPADVIVLTDSEDALDDQHELRHERQHSESCAEDNDVHHIEMENSISQHGKSPDRLEAIHEESYDLPQTGPKTPPEPGPEPETPVVKFNLLPKQKPKQNAVRNPLHDAEEDDLHSGEDLEERQDRQPQPQQQQPQQQPQPQEQHRQEIEEIHAQSNQSGQKVGPNTPPESGPCSPDAYDPFEPTKSPSMSPRSPTPPPLPPPLDVVQSSVCDSNDAIPTQKHVNADEPRPQQQTAGVGSSGVQGATLNPVELVMALMNSKSGINNSQDLTNKSSDSQFSSNLSGNAHDDTILRDKSEETNNITVLSNVLLSTGSVQHIPSISSPTPPTVTKRLPSVPKLGGSVGGSSSSGANARSGGSGIAVGVANAADDSFNINDCDSPYSPGSADYEDLFEPPPDTNAKKRSSKHISASGGGSKTEVFDHLFGSSSPIGGHLRLSSSYTPSSKKHRNTTVSGAIRKSIVKVGKSADDHVKLYDDVPNSAVELQVKDKFLRKLNRQERVVEEVKLVLKPRFNKKQITKEDYKEIMRRAVPKICHSRSGEIDPHKIKNLIEAYVKKFRAKHKKLSLINTGQVSSAVKCAAYLKKL